VSVRPAAAHRIVLMLHLPVDGDGQMNYTDFVKVDGTCPFAVTQI
jgi:hypothetical protein